MGGELFTLACLTETRPKMNCHITVRQLESAQLIRPFPAVALRLRQQCELSVASGSRRSNQAVQCFSMPLKRLGQERVSIDETRREQLLWGLPGDKSGSACGLTGLIAECFKPSLPDQSSSLILNKLLRTDQHPDGVEQHRLGHGIGDQSAPVAV